MSFLHTHVRAHTRIRDPLDKYLGCAEKGNPRNPPYKIGCNTREDAE